MIISRSTPTNLSNTDHPREAAGRSQKKSMQRSDDSVAKENFFLSKQLSDCAQTLPVERAYHPEMGRVVRNID